MPPSKLLLIILDGVGEAPDGPGNAVKRAKTPYMDALYAKYPWTLLQASGRAIGAPEGVDGSSEPGHITLGAGQIVWQPFERINRAIAEGTFTSNAAFAHVFDYLAESGGKLHLMGLLSDGGIHSHINHCFALLRAAKAKGIKEVLIHAIADGRDVSERSVGKYIEELRMKIEGLPCAQDPSGLQPPSLSKGRTTPDLATRACPRAPSRDYRLSTLIGRYYAMDRGKNWDRTKKAYDLYAEGNGETVENLDEALESYFSTAPEGEATDYYLPPMKFDPDFDGIAEGDGVIFWNFRADRSLQIVSAFESGDFEAFPRKASLTVPHIAFACMGPYSATLPVAFPEEKVANNLGSWIASKGIRQLRVAEKDKFAHVTFFFNSQQHDPYPGEDRIIVPSKDVANFAQAPQMSAAEITDALRDAVAKKEYGLIVANYANGDLVGHGGHLEATIQAMEAVDASLARIVPEALKNGYTVILTADHGNAESMLEPDGSANPSHTSNPVRCAIIGEGFTKGTRLRENMGLSSIAPTVLGIMGIEKPGEMDEGLLG